MSESEESLVGGNVSEAVVRVGKTVRKTSTLGTASVHHFLCYLSSAGFEAAPRSIGVDQQGRHMLEYISGQAAQARQWTPIELKRVGEIIRRFHNLSSQYRPPFLASWNVVMPSDGDDLICHNDLAPWNLICDGERWVFIDWDGAAPGTRLWDLAYAAVTFLPVTPDTPLSAASAGLRALVDGYQLSAADRQALPRYMVRRARAMYELLRQGAEQGAQPWARLYAAGHAAYWGPTADYLDQHRFLLETSITTSGR